MIKAKRKYDNLHLASMHKSKHQVGNLYLVLVYKFLISLKNQIFQIILTNFLN